MPFGALVQHSISHYNNAPASVSYKPYRKGAFIPFTGKETESQGGLSSTRMAREWQTEAKLKILRSYPLYSRP